MVQVRVGEGFNTDNLSVRAVVLGNVDVAPVRVSPIDLEEEAPEGLVTALALLACGNLRCRRGPRGRVHTRAKIAF